MRAIIKKYYKEFLLRGLMVCGAGPLVLAIIYVTLGSFGIVTALSPIEVALGIISLTILAFLAAGITVVYKIEELLLPGAIALHGIVLYLGYSVTYLLNNWLSPGFYAFLAFTVIFIVVYFLTWGIVYLCIRKKVDKINKNFIK